MADVRTNALRMHELVAHITRWEHEFRFFYGDSKKLVTIGIGHLVDESGANIARGQAFARTLFRTNGVVLRHKVTNNPASEQQVVDDWTRVKEHSLANDNLRARGFANIAHLRITDQVMQHLLRQVRLHNFLNQLYDREPFILGLDERIHMALVDVRFNPSGVSLYRLTPGGKFHRLIPPMWSALDPSSPDHDLDEALRIFDVIWRNRGGDRAPNYPLRHAARVALFAAGVAAMSS
jgi:hypothetical protein